MNKKKGNLAVKLDFVFEEVGDIPELNYEVKLKPKKENSKINIVKKKKHGRDASTNKLF